LSATREADAGQLQPGLQAAGRPDAAVEHAGAADGVNLDPPRLELVRQPLGEVPRIFVEGHGDPPIIPETMRPSPSPSSAAGARTPRVSPRPRILSAPAGPRRRADRPRGCRRTRAAPGGPAGGGAPPPTARAAGRR